MLGVEWFDNECRTQRETGESTSRPTREIASLLAALRAADFDLGDAGSRDDERLLTAMFQDWRHRYERRQRRWAIAGKAVKWIFMAIGGAAVTLFGPDAHQWLKSHYWP